MLYANDDKDNTITPEQAAQAAEDAHSRFPDKTNSTENIEINTGTDSSSDAPAGDEQPKKNINMNSIYIAVGAVIIGAVCIVLIKFLKKPKKKIEIPENDDEDINFYNDNEINEDDE